MTRRSLLLDAALAAVVFGLVLAIAAAGGLDDPPPSAADLDPLGLLLIALACLPLAARRRVPLLVYLAVSAATLALWILEYRTEIPVGPLIAIYTVGSIYGGMRWPRRITAMLAVAALVPAAAGVYVHQGSHLPEIVMPYLVLWALLLTGVWITGDRARLRRERLAALEERARRGEQEVARERRVAAAEERLRIARELHDSAGHALNVILVQAGAARLLQEQNPPDSRQAIATVEQVARETIGEIDRLVHALREGEPADPMPADPAAIEELLDRHRANGLRVVAELRGSRRAVPRSVAWAAYRILQEALTNAARHGQGSAEIVVDFQAAAVELTVTNPVAPAAAANTGGHGVAGMRERATLLGGAFEVGVAGGVFRLQARLPHPEPAPV